jgi:hypothetical protein
MLIAASVTVQGQALLSAVYQNGDVSLVPDAGYGQQNDWESLFPDYGQTMVNKPVGVSKHIVVAPDGSVFMSHRTRHSISQFDKDGNFVREFGKKGGKNPADFIYMPSVEGILDGKYLYTTAVDGRMHFFALDGKWVKTITLKYLPLGTVPLKNGKIALLGYVPWKGEQSRNIISILNFNTGKEQTVHSEFEPYATHKTIHIQPFTYRDKNGKERRSGTMTCSVPFSHPTYYRRRFATDKDGNLVIANPANGEITVFDGTGKKLRQFKTDIQPETITAEDREAYYESAVESIKKWENETKETGCSDYQEKYMEQYKQQVEKFRDPANYPANLPYFSEMLIDSDNNILLCRFTREAGSNRFDVFTYDSQGKHIATSSFVADGYDLKINPSVFKFYNGFVYSWLKINNVESGNPFRLVKFKVENKKPADNFF